MVDGLVTSYLEAGTGDPVVLLHGGEFGASAELGWEHTISALATRYRVLAPDMLGYGYSAKVLDFVDGRGLRIRHIARFCAVLGLESAVFIGNSMGAINLLVDATSEFPRLPMRAMVAICGGGEIQANRHMAALYDYDATLPAMRLIVEALFHSPRFPGDDHYVLRRHESAKACRGAGPGLEQAGLRSHCGADAGDRRRPGQTASVGMGGRNRQSDYRWAVGRHRRRWALPTDRTIRVDERGADDFSDTG